MLKLKDKVNDQLIAEIDELRQQIAEMEIAIDTAETTNRAKSEFFANVSREIQSPANIISDLSEINHDKNLTPEQREKISTVTDAANSILYLFNSFNDILKIDFGKLELQKTNFNLESLLASIITTLAPHANEKDLELLCQISPDIPGNIKGDEVRLRQILIHLVSNAIKFTNEGNIIINVTGIALDNGNKKITKNGDVQVIPLIFSISDTGIGIPQDKLDRIFENFTPTDDPVIREHNETRLGLCITNKLIHMMGGEIWAESEQGKGSTFHFTLTCE